MPRSDPGPLKKMTAIPTIKIDDGHGGFIVINYSDFDKAFQQRFKPQLPPKQRGRPRKSVGFPVELETEKSPSE